MTQQPLRTPFSLSSLLLATAGYAVLRAIDLNQGLEGTRSSAPPLFALSFLALVLASCAKTHWLKLILSVTVVESGYFFLHRELDVGAYSLEELGALLASAILGAWALQRIAKKIDSVEGRMLGVVSIVSLLVALTYGGLSSALQISSSHFFQDAVRAATAAVVMLPLGLTLWSKGIEKSLKELALPEELLKLIGFSAAFFLVFQQVAFPVMFSGISFLIFCYLSRTITATVALASIGSVASYTLSAEIPPDSGYALLFMADRAFMAGLSTLFPAAFLLMAVVQARVWLEQAKAREAAVKTAYNVTPALLFKTNGSLVIEAASEQLCRRLNLEAGALDGRSFYDLVPPLRREPLRETIAALHSSKEGLLTFDTELLNRKNTLLEARVTARVLSAAAGSGSSIAFAIEDLTEQNQASRRLHAIAHTDPITGLFNPDSLHLRVARLQEKADALGRQFVVATIGVLRAQELSANLGYQGLNTLARTLADRIRATVRTTDTIAKTGQLEFVVVLEKNTSDEDGETALHHAISALEAPVFVSDEKGEVYPSLAVGLAVYPQDANNVDSLLQRSKLALIRARSEGAAQLEYFSPRADSVVSQEFDVENRLRASLAKNEFFLLFQPKISASSGSIRGCEALVRWKNGNRPVALPHEFLRVAERARLLLPLSERVLKQAVRQVHVWLAEKYNIRSVSVNVSGPELWHSQFLDMVVGVLQAEGVRGHYLEFEIPEVALFRAPVDSRERLYALQRLGINLTLASTSLGVGLLNYATRMPFSGVKINKNLMADSLREPISSDLLAGYIQAAKRAGLAVTAEGVETEQQLETLLARGVDYVQGHLLGKPCEPDLLTPLLVKTKGKLRAVTSHAKLY